MFMGQTVPYDIFFRGVYHDFQKTYHDFQIILRPQKRFVWLHSCSIQTFLLPLRQKYVNMENYKFYKNKRTDAIWWVDNAEYVGIHLFSFDKKTVFNLFQDYPYKLTKEQKAIFDKENPFWADFFGSGTI